MHLRPDVSVNSSWLDQCLPWTVAFYGYSLMLIIIFAVIFFSDIYTDREYEHTHYSLWRAGF